MLIKGFVSKKNEGDNTVEVTLPEYNNVVTSPLKLYNRPMARVNVGDFVVVALFSENDLCDGVVI